jgi:hypothetical protein
LIWEEAPIPNVERRYWQKLLMASNLVFKASGKSLALKKLSVAPETAEQKKTKEKVKASRSKKPTSLADDQLFLGK